jgi:hypothetical protein
MANKAKAQTADQEIIERLDKILLLLALQVASDKSITEGARLLKVAGIDNQTIAFVLNTTDATVRVVTANLRKPKSALHRRGGLARYQSEL